MLKELVIRMIIGGSVVSVFAVLGDIFTPKRFAGLFGAAPSVALATLALTAGTEGRLYAATEAHSMIGGAIAFFVYAWCVCFATIRFKLSAMLVTSSLLIVWAAVAFSLWFVWLQSCP